jgi:hypothetical protein
VSDPAAHRVHPPRRREAVFVPLRVRQTISTKDEFTDLSSNTSAMLSPVGMA